MSYLFGSAAGRIAPTKAEKHEGRLKPEKLAHLVAQLQTDGYVVLENVIHPELLQSLSPHLDQQAARQAVDNHLGNPTPGQGAGGMRILDPSDPSHQRDSEIKPAQRAPGHLQLGLQRTHPFITPVGTQAIPTAT